MKKNFRKFFAVVLVVAMLAAQFTFPVTAAPTTTVQHCSECGNRGVYDDAQANPRVIEVCDATYTIYDCINPDVDGNGTPCNGTITIESAGTGLHTPDGNVVEAVAVDCVTDGNVKYQKCEVCDCYLNVPAAGETLQVLTENQVFFPATGHDLTVVSSETPDCTQPGKEWHYKCLDCGWLFDPADVDQTNSYADPTAPTTVPGEIGMTNHNYTVFNAAKPATCREPGYSAYYSCSVCGKIDPERPKVEEEIQDHGFGIVNDPALTFAPTCTEDGQNFFKCNKQGCPYFNGATEILPKLGHDLTLVPAADPKCETAGNKAYYTCSRCANSKFEVPQTGTLILPADKNAANYADILALNVAAAPNYDPTIAALGHTRVAIDFKAATCNTTGLVDAIVCDRECCEEYDAEKGYGKVHYAGDVSPALGHNLTPVAADPADCITDGNKAHYFCSVCEKTFAIPATGTLIIPGASDPNYAAIYAANIAAPEFDAVIPALGHDYEKTVQAATCTQVGYEIYTCKRDCRLTGYVYSVELPANGHTPVDVPYKAPDCTHEGNEAYKACACGQLFDADGEEITAIPTIPALGHDPIEVPFKAPTYDQAGNLPGTKCSVCDVAVVNAQPIRELKEAIEFTFDFVGVGGSNVAVNSGYLQVEISFEVLEDDISDILANIPAEYHDKIVADAIANIFGIDFKFEFVKDVFTLTHVVVADGVFNEAYFTNLETANTNGYVKLNQNMGSDDYAAFTAGEAIPFATLTFQVADVLPTGYEFTNTVTPFAGYVFGFDGAANVIHKEDETDNTEIIGVTGDTDVIVPLYRLGDANKDGEFTNSDVIMLRNFLKNRVDASAYNTIYDLDKDGFVTVGDLALLSNAVVENNTYLDIDVCPYGTCYTVVE